MRKRTLLAAGIVQDFRFQNEAEFDIHIYAMKHDEIRFKVLEKVQERGGTVLARIVKESGAAPLIELYED